MGVWFVFFFGVCWMVSGLGWLDCMWFRLVGFIAVFRGGGVPLEVMIIIFLSIKKQC